MTEYEMVGWHHRLYGHKFEQALGGSWRWTRKPGVRSQNEVTKSWT